jgi:hypothetical protein
VGEITNEIRIVGGREKANEQRKMEGGRQTGGAGQAVPRRM